MPNNPKVSRGSDEARAWAKQRALEMGQAVKHARDNAGLSASKLEAKTRELGYPITRGTIAKIEGGHRDGKFDVNEVVVLATALGVTPLDIVFPPTSAPVEYLPGQELSTGEALVRWAASPARELALARRRLLTQHELLYEQFLESWGGNDLSELPTESRLEVDALILKSGLVAEELETNWTKQRDLGLVHGDDPYAPDYEASLINIRERRDLRKRRPQDNG